MGLQLRFWSYRFFSGDANLEAFLTVVFVISGFVLRHAAEERKGKIALHVFNDARNDFSGRKGVRPSGSELESAATAYTNVAILPLLILFRPRELYGSNKRQKGNYRELLSE